MKTAEECKDYEENVLSNNEHYKKYFDEWSLYWFRKIFKPVIDYCNVHIKYIREQYTDLPLKLFNQSKNKRKGFQGGGLEVEKKTKLYYKLKKYRKKIEKLFPNMVLIDQEEFERKCDNKFLSDRKIKVLSLMNYPNLNYMDRNDCSFLIFNKNLTENTKKKYPQYNWNYDDNKFFFGFERRCGINYDENGLPLELNNNLTIEKIKQNKNYPWKIKELGRNDFTVMRVLWIKEKIQEFDKNNS